MATITESLEAIALEVRENVIARERKPTALSSLEHEIALTSEQLDRLRQVHKEQLRRIVRAECYVDSDLIKLQSYQPAVFLFRLKVRDSLEGKLLNLDMERRKRIASYEKDIATLHDRLLSLLAQHAHLKP